MSALQDYLKRYTSDEKKKKKKKKKKSTASNGGALTIIDADAVWQKDVKEESSESEAEQEDAPLVIEDVEFKRMQRLEALRMMRPYLGTADDGSGWVSLNDNQNQEECTLLKESLAEDGMDAGLPSSPRKETDMSPERQETDLSPPRRQRHDSLSPPHCHDCAELSPEKQDLSPQRRDRRFGREDALKSKPKSQDLSPPRRHAKSFDLAPPRIEQMHAGKVDTDLSPARRKSQDSLGSRDLSKRKREEVMRDGIAVGLQSGRQLANEINLKKTKESKRVKELDMSISGRNASTVYRDKHGKRLEGVDEILKLQQGEEPKKEERPLEWGKGLVQKREAEAQHAELEAERAKPFARTREDLDAALREQIRWGDPMAHLVKKKVAEPVLLDLGASEQMKDSGFIVPQDIPAHSWLKRGIAPPPNRYGIKPGRHWDGVDRSTGFERDMYKRQNEKKAEQVEAYLWSVADM